MTGGDESMPHKIYIFGIRNILRKRRCRRSSANRIDITLV